MKNRTVSILTNYYFSDSS